MKTYNEDVDLESDDGRKELRSWRAFATGNSAASLHSSLNAGTDSESDTSGAASGGESRLGAGKRRRSALTLSIVRPIKGTPGSNVETVTAQMITATARMRPHDLAIPEKGRCGNTKVGRKDLPLLAHDQGS